MYPHNMYPHKMYPTKNISDHKIYSVAKCIQSQNVSNKFIFYHKTNVLKNVKLCTISVCYKVEHYYTSSGHNLTLWMLRLSYLLCNSFYSADKTILRKVYKCIFRIYLVSDTFCGGYISCGYILCRIHFVCAPKNKHLQLSLLHNIKPGGNTILKLKVIFKFLAIFNIWRHIVYVLCYVYSLFLECPEYKVYLIFCTSILKSTFQVFMKKYSDTCPK